MIDQNGAIGKGGLADVVAARNVIHNASRALNHARSEGHLVAHVRLGFRADYADVLSRAPRIEKLKSAHACISTSWGCEFPELLKPTPNEMIITKQCVNPFYNTLLMPWLARHGIEKLVIGGVVTNLVVETTARAADDAGFHIRVLEDCCAAPNPAWHAFSIGSMLPMFSEITTSQTYASGD